MGKITDMLPGNPIAQYIPDLGVIKIITISAVDEPNTPIIIMIRWDSMFELGFTSQPHDIKCTSFSAQTPTVVRCPIKWKLPQEIEWWVSEIGWKLGGGYMYRWHKSPVSPDDSGGMGALRHFFGIPQYEIMGEDDLIGDTDNVDLVTIAAEKGHWEWEVNCAYRKEFGHSKIFWKRWKETDPSLAGDGSRDANFPGWEGRHPFLRATEPHTGYGSHFFYCLPKNGKNKRDAFVVGL